MSRTQRPDPAPLFAQAARLHQAGRLDEAERFYLQALALDPGHADSLHLLGVIALQRGRHDQAAGLIRKAVAANPAHAEAHNNLGVALQQLGQGEAAAAACARAVALKPAYAQAHYNHGVALQGLGRLDEAIAAYGRALTLNPDLADACNNLGNALRDAGRLDEAEQAYDRALALRPALAEAHNNLGVLHRRRGRHAAAAGAYRRAIALRPGYAEACSNLGNALKELGRYDEAIAAYRDALRLDPAFTQAHLNLALALGELGQADEARTAVDQALALAPALAQAWYMRADLKTFAPGDPDLARMEALLAQAQADPSADADGQLVLGFALGKAWMDAGDPDRAFAHLERSNRRKRAGFTYDVRDDLAPLAEVARTFTPEAMARLSGGGDPSELPVFVVGMPRSGGTLVEQILASHPAVHGAGELGVLDAVIHGRPGPTPYPRLPDTLAREELERMGRAYVDQVAALAPGKRRVVDKAPGNFRFAGLIALMLPNARIVHCRRDPVDTCLSCYSKTFTDPVAYAYDLGELGAAYRGYAGLMAHWREALPPGRLIELDYEALVEDLETQVRRLLAFCGLAFDPACLDFHQTRRPVRTASVNQARRPIYRTSVARWKPYAHHLGPLLEALEG